MARRVGPYHDGRVHVMAQPCPTCIFRPGNLMQLHEDRVAGMLHDCQQQDRVIPCHETLSGVQAVCYGLYARREVFPGVAVLQLADRLKMAVLDGVPNGATAHLPEEE